MKNSILHYTFISLFVLSFQSMAYIPADKEKFKNKTNCSNCNLSDASFSSWDYIEKSHANLDNTYFTRTNLEQIKSIKCSIMPNGEMNSNGC